jgi:RNA polymerase sigma-70 factor, ECF subfamily
VTGSPDASTGRAGHPPLDGAGVTDGRHARFERLLREYGAALERLVAVHELDVAEREDLMQDIAFALWRALPSYRGACSERTFLYRIAHNRALTHRARRRRNVVDELPDLADPAPGPDRVASAHDEHERLVAAVRALPVSLGQCVALRLEGLRIAEVADVMGLTETNVAVRLTRARARLRVLLGEKHDA